MIPFNLFTSLKPVSPQGGLCIQVFLLSGYNMNPLKIASRGCQGHSDEVVKKLMLRPTFLSFKACCLSLPSVLDKKGF